MSVAFPSTTRYQISSPVLNGGGILSMSTTGLYLTLEGDLNDDSQQWIFWASEFTSGYAIENYKFDTHYISKERIPGLLNPAKEPMDWYIFPGESNPTYYSICQDPGCALAWAPYTIAGGPSDGNEVNVITPTGTERELWQIVPVGSVDVPTPTASPPSSSAAAATTAPFTVIPDPTSTKPSIPAQTEASDLSEEDMNVVKACCGDAKEKCHFKSSSDATSPTYAVLIGQPVANCDSASQDNTVTKLGGSFELQHSFSYQVTSSGGLGFAGPSIGLSTSVGEERTTKIAQVQEVEVIVRPGFMGALVANVSYSTRPGEMTVDKRTLAFVSIQPEKVNAIFVVYADCKANFDAFNLPRAPGCLGNSVPRNAQLKGVFVCAGLAWVWFWMWV